MSRSAAPLAALILAAAASGAASAAEVDFEAAAVSDYQFRGYSLTDGQPALQGGVTVESSGFYGNVWGSTIDEYGSDADGEGATVELDFTVGRAWRIGQYDLDLALAAYTYPGGEGVNYVEIPVSVSRAAGAWTWTLGGAYAPAQENLGDQDNAYVFGAVDFAPEAWPLALDASLGWEDGAFADRKLDWSVGVTRALGPVTLGVRYVDADDPEVNGVLVGSLGVAF